MVIPRTPAVAVLITACSALSAVSTAFGAEEVKLPPHPTLVYAQSQLVIAADNHQPVIDGGGKHIVLSENTPLATERTAGYLPGVTADVKVAQLSTRPVTLDALGDRKLKGQESECTFTLTPSADLQNCFLLSVSYDKDSLHDPEVSDSSSISVVEVGNLTAGKPFQKTVKLNVVFPERYTDKPLAMGPSYINMQTFWLLFSNGTEVDTGRSSIAAKFFYHRERMAHLMAVKAWKNAHASDSQPPRPILQIPPLLKDTAGLPATNVTLTVGPDGLVSDVKLDPALPKDPAEILETTFRAWLFLPAIKNGVATSTRLRMPLQF